MISSQQFGLPVFDLTVLDTEMAAVALVQETLITKLKAMPLFKRGNKLFIAISSPTNIHALGEFKFATGMSTETALVQENPLIEFIEKAVRSMDTGIEGMMLDDSLEDLDIRSDEEEQARPTQADAEEAPVVNYVNQLLLDAINKSTSDFHFDTYQKRYRMRYRIDDILSEVASPPISKRSISPVPCGKPLESIGDDTRPGPDPAAVRLPHRKTDPGTVIKRVKLR